MSPREAIEFLSQRSPCQVIGSDGWTVRPLSGENYWILTVSGKRHQFYHAPSEVDRMGSFLLSLPADAEVEVE